MARSLTVEQGKCLSTDTLSSNTGSGPCPSPGSTFTQQRPSPDTARSAQLLEGPSLKPSLSVAAATVTYTQNILGSGVLALPYAFKSAGLEGALALLALIFVLSTFSMGVLVLLSNRLHHFSYKGAAEQTLGKTLAWVVEVWVLMYSLGICISYVVLLGDFFGDVAEYFELGGWANKRIGMLLFMGCVCWPLSCARSLGVLKYTSFVGVLAIVFATVVVVIRYADGSYAGSQTNHPKMFNLHDFGSCFPILVGAFGAHYNVPSLYAEVAPDAGQMDAAADKRGFRRMMMVILSSLVLSSIVYGTVGVVVYLTFGSLTESDFSKNFHPNDSLLVVLRTAMMFALCVTFPLSMVSARGSALKLLRWNNSYRLQVASATGLCGLALAVALAAGDVGVVLAYNGSVFGTPVCYVIPMVMYLKMQRSHQTPGWRLFSIVCAILGVFFGILGIVVVSFNLMND